MSTVRRAMVFSFLESYLGIALNLVSFVLLARLLTPKQVGLFSVALAIISVTQVIRDFGLVNFLIQKKELTGEYIASAWGLALILGCSLFLLIQLCAPLIGAFYHEESLTTIARIVALNFLILPFNSVCLALLRRELNFQSVMRINLSAAVLSTIATLLMAWQGAGAYALAFGAVLNNAIIAAGIWHVGAAGRLLRPALTKWREIMKFGGPLTVANVITSITMDINDLAVGKIMGFSAVAIASRAQGLMNLFHRDFMGAVRNVAYPAFSKAVRNDDKLEEKYVVSVTNVTAIAWTFYGFAALFPLEVLRLMFGPQWDQSAPLVPFFCLAGAASAMINLTPTVLLAAGHSKLVATAELIIQPVKAIALCLVVFYYRNLQYFAIGFMVMALVSVPYWYALKQRRLPTDFGALLRYVGMNLMLALLSLAPAIALTLWLRPAGQALGHAAFFTCAGATCVAWPLLLWAFRHPLYREFLAIVQARRASAPGK
ncbi:lipopolysaccharide biosynthesis protein [Massilia sp. CCM 8734]|uniref:lipopolysaccharide biosynthesis protein n=1 Tax=Massilia sp. CCM 8734 TaxID=2609283 RepID=UPI0014219C43|nr:lipopolysaccharide biosynthesis protein [Massilia sp. CCM 8734]NHZ97207.1 oligosaccharide flippase family protein [Massilia sp. CCM 8734]